MKYFFECKTLDEIKAQYKRLAKQNHPDMGGDTATMQEINKEYAFACAHIFKTENLSAEDIDSKLKMSEGYRQAIEKIIHLPGIVIELVGFWIWVTGDTYQVRRNLKEAGFFFASKKVAWYFRGDEYKSRGSQKTLEQIRRKYGSETVSASNSNRTIED